MLVIDAATYGSNHPTVIVRISNLGLTLWDSGALPEACATFERPLYIFTESLGVEHPSIQTAHDYLDALMREGM